MPEEKDPSTEQRHLIDQECTLAALEASAASLATNRFEILPHRDGSEAGAILVFGSVVAGMIGASEETAEPFLKVRMHGAYTVDRKLAANVAAKLQVVLNLSSDELQAARDRYTHDRSSDG